MWNYLEGNGWICKVGLENLVCWWVVVVWFDGGCLWLLFVVVVIWFVLMCVFFLGGVLWLVFFWWLEELGRGVLLVDLFLLVGSYNFWFVGCWEIEDWLVCFLFLFLFVCFDVDIVFWVVVVNCEWILGWDVGVCVWWLVVNWLVVYLICFEIWIKEFNMCVSYWVLWNLKV